MTKQKLLFPALIFLGYFSLAGVASSAESAGDPAAGEQKAAACVGCHGSKGQSNNSQWPNLAGQQANYLLNQLAAFKSGSRGNPMMQGMAANLSDADMANLAAYFSSLPPVSSGSDAALAKTGKEKAAMCLGCHGQQAEGRGQIPRLAGQQPEYLSKQLADFKQGTRKGGPMPAIAGGLSESDMSELAAYLATLK